MRCLMPALVLSLLLAVSVRAQEPDIVGVWEQLFGENLAIAQFRADGIYISNGYVSGRLLSMTIGTYRVVGDTVTVVHTLFQLVDEDEGGSVDIDTDEVASVDGDQYRVRARDTVERVRFSVTGDQLTLSENTVLTRSLRTLVVPPSVTRTAVTERTWGMVKSSMTP